MIVTPNPVTLGPDETRWIDFTVTVPAAPTSTVLIDHIIVTATATTLCSDSHVTEHTIIINQEPGLTLVQNESGGGLPGDTVTYEHILTNTGNWWDSTITVTWETDPDWVVSVIPDEPVVEDSKSVTLTVEVIVPEAATCGAANTTVITATSYAGYYAPDYQIVSVSVTDITTVTHINDVEFAPDRADNLVSDPAQPVTATYTHRITNTGNCRQQFGFLSHSSQGFTVTTPSWVWLDPEDATPVTIFITAPPTATDNLLVDTTVITAYHWGEPDLPTAAVVDTTIVNQAAGVELAPNNTSVITQPAITTVPVTYTHTLTNSGNYTDTFDLTWLNEDGWETTVNGQTEQPAEVTVGASRTTTVSVVTILPEWVYTLTNQTVVTAASQLSPTVTAIATDTTTARRPGVLLWPDHDQYVAPGDIITYTHRLTNVGGISDSYVITYHSIMGWASVTPTVVPTLAPGSGVLVLATISVPTSTDILSGTEDLLVITATSQITDIVYDTAVDVTTVPYVPGAALTPDPGNQASQAGIPVPYTHTLTNLGNYTESFHLQIWSEFANGSVSPEWVLDLGPGEAYTSVIVTVLLPTHAAAGETEETQVLISFAGERVVARDYTLVLATTGTRHVAPEGTDDNNSCLVPYDYGPCATVQQAVDQALAGDDVLVAQGVYTDVQATSGYTEAVYLDKNLTLLGGYVNAGWDASPDPAINETALDAGGQGRVVYVAAGVTATIEGFHLRQGYVEGDGAGIYVASGAAPTVRRNFIYSNTATGAESKGGGVYYAYTSGDSDLVLERNMIYGNTAGAEGGGFYVYGSYGSGGRQRVWNNLFYHNVADDGGGLYLAGDSALVWNDTFYSNTATNGGGIYLAAGSSSISNTILSSNANYGVFKPTGLGGAPQLDYNLAWVNSPDNFNAEVDPGANTITTTTPGFVDPAGYDFHLRSNSNAIDQGDPNGTLPDEDLDGNSRPLASYHDIGAYENGLQSKKTAVEYAPAGGTLTYTIAITNSGQAHRDIVVTDRLHDYLDYAGLSSTPTGSSNYSDHTVSWEGVVYSSTTAYITVTTTVTDWLIAGTIITNVAEINYVPGSVVTTVVTGTHGARYVAETGHDTMNNCMRPDMPCLTIQYAADHALAGDEVQVASGVYTGATQVAYLGKDLTLTGGYTPTLPAWIYDPSANTTTLDAQGNAGVVIANSATGVLGGLHIINGADGVDVNAATVVISQCHIYNNTDGVDVNGGSYTLINSVVAHNSGAGVRAASGSDGSLLHNTFARNAAAGAIVSDTAHFTNTIFYSHSVGVNVVAGSAYLSNTLWYSNTANQGNVISSADLFDVDPRFENPDGVDYHIQPGSSVIDEGLDTWLSEDIDGDARPLLQHPDLGADEFALVIVKSAPASADPDQIITYTLMLQGGESGLVLTDTLDAYLTHVGAVECDVGSCGYLPSQRAITWSGDAPAAYPIYITYTAQITSWLAPGAQILNDAQVLIEGDVHNTNQTATTINTASGPRYVDAASGVDSDGAGNNCLASWKPCATVQWAVDQAQASDTVKVAGDDYTGSGSEVVGVSKNLTLTGGYAASDWNASAPEANPTRLSGQDARRVVVVTGAVSVTIDGFHLLNGSVSGDGGGLYIDGGATVTLVNSRVYNNSVSGTGNGGGVYAGSGALTLSQSQVYSNTAISGGGVYAANANLTLRDNRIYTNTATFQGGGLYALNSPVLMERNVILDNQADLGGGGAITNTARITMTNNIIGANRASAGGDGLLFDGSGSGDLRHNTIADNGDEGVRVGNFTLNLTNTILSGHTVGITTSHAGASVAADHTLLNGNGTDYNASSGSIVNSNDVTGSPNYRDQAGMDYHITGSSAALGAGINAGVSADIDGENRASPPDIGADQYNLRVDRWASAAELAPCQTMTHTLMLVNVADSAISGVVLTDTLPAEVAYNTGSLTYTAGGGAYSGAPPAITWNGDLAAQSSVYITYTVNVNPYLADGAVITFTVAISDPVSVFSGNPLTATVRTIPAAISKAGENSISPAGQATIGELVTYTLVYTVPGGHKAYDPVVVDELPRLVESGGALSTDPALAYAPGSLSITGATTQTEEISADGGAITWTLNSVTATCGAPAVATLTFNARVLDRTDNDDGDTLTNTVTVSYTEGSLSGPARLTSAHQTFALIEPGLTLAHTTSPALNLGMGDLVIVAITATNSGNATLYDVIITDTLGSGWVVSDTGGSVFTHTFGSIAAGDSSAVALTARVNSDVGANVPLVATAQGQGSSMPGVASEERIYEDTIQATPRTGYPDLVISKSGPATSVPGQTIFYTLVYTNAGVVRAEGVQITDTLPLSLTNIISATSAGATVERVGQTITWTLTAPVSRSVSGQVWITGTVMSIAQRGDILLNTAGIAALATTEQALGNNSDFITTTVVEPEAHIVKVMAPSTDLGSGDEVTVTLTVSNTGSSPLYDAVVTDTLPAGLSFQSALPVPDAQAGAAITWTLSSLGAGQQQVYTVIALVEETVGANETLTNRAGVLGDSQSGAVAEQRFYTDTAQAMVTTGYPDLTFEKSGPAVRSPNQSIVYTLTYTNTGKVRAVDVRITDTLPLSLTNVVSSTSAGATAERVGQTITWTLNDPVSRNASGQVLVTAVVAGTAQEGSVLTNSAAISTATSEPDETDNGDLVTTTVRIPSLSITKTLDPEEPLTAQLLTYTLTISNSGLGDATDLLISDTLPLSTTYHSCGGGDCGFNSGNDTITWTLPLLPAGEQTPVIFTVLVDSGAYSSTVIINQTFAVTCAQGVGDAGGPVTSTVPLRRELELEPPAAQEFILPGAQVVYTHTLINWGTVVAPAVTLTVSDPPAGWAYTLQPTQVISLDVGAAAGKLVTLTVQSLADSGNAAATITATWEGVTETYAVDTTNIDCVPISNISIDYTPTTPRIGQTVTFTGTVATNCTTPIDYIWDFGDGAQVEQTGVGQTISVASHLYDDDADYTVTFTATNCGGSAHDTEIITVNPYNIYLPLVLRSYH